MLLKTHLAFAILVIMFFFDHVNNSWVFTGLVLIATIIPDLDMNSSKLGRHLIFKPLQFFIKHRGVIHSFTTAVVISVVLSLFWPAASLGFFIGYSVHLICDSFTKEGIRPFWPLRAKSSGFISTGGRIEESLFFSLIFINIIFFFLIFVL